MKCLLKRWREKVFVLLVQRKLEEIESARRTVELQARVCLTHVPGQESTCSCTGGFNGGGGAGM